jgi:hypothetical protein
MRLCLALVSASACTSNGAGARADAAADQSGRDEAAEAPAEHTADAPAPDAATDAGVDAACHSTLAGLYPAVRVGGSPVGVAVADFDRDGRLDVAVASNAPVNGGHSMLGVVFGRGLGTFAPATLIATGELQTGVVAGDFNHDGAPDIAVADWGAAGVEVLLNQGDGTFRAPVTYATSADPQAIAVADLDGDGVLDLATVDSFAARGLAVLKGRGDGTFVTKQDYMTETQSQGLAIGDVNGDGVPDIVVANRTPGAPTVKTFLGSRTSPLAYTQSTPAPVSDAIAVILADLNEDRHPDVVVMGALGPAVLLGRGDGTYGAPAPVAVAGAIGGNGLLAADLDGDGHLDLAVTTGSASGYRTSGETVIVASGVGDGTFRPPQAFQAGSLPYALGVADFTGDGRPDLVAADKGTAVLAPLVG